MSPVDTKYKKHIGDFLLEYDHQAAYIKVSYKGDLLRAYDVKVDEADSRFEYYRKKLQDMSDNQ
jgi:hypothetical protein|tara:strand:+ start:372 stop:563 length:192 start_codon:yes stop_codon:yes gene_type:complete